jgi:hypothetical protein
MTPRKRKPAYDPPSNPIRLFHHFRKQSIDPSKSEIEREVARNAMMDCLSVIPWGLGLENILDMKD